MHALQDMAAGPEQGDKRNDAAQKFSIILFWLPECYTPHLWFLLSATAAQMTLLKPQAQSDTRP